MLRDCGRSLKNSSNGDALRVEKAGRVEVRSLLPKGTKRRL